METQMMIEIGLFGGAILILLVAIYLTIQATRQLILSKAEFKLVKELSLNNMAWMKNQIADFKVDIDAYRSEAGVAIGQHKADDPHPNLDATKVWTNFHQFEASIKDIDSRVHNLSNGRILIENRIHALEKAGRDTNPLKAITTKIPETSLEIARAGNKIDFVKYPIAKKPVRTRNAKGQYAKES